MNRWCRFDKSTQTGAILYCRRPICGAGQGPLFRPAPHPVPPIMERSDRACRPARRLLSPAPLPRRGVWGEGNVGRTGYRPPKMRPVEVYWKHEEAEGRQKGVREAQRGNPFPRAPGGSRAAAGDKKHKVPPIMERSDRACRPARRLLSPAPLPRRGGWGEGNVGRTGYRPPKKASILWRPFCVGGTGFEPVTLCL